MAKPQEMLEKMRAMTEQIDVDRVFGKPETVGDRVIIPVATLSYGFGMGLGGPEAVDEDEPAASGGVGGGAVARPIAYIEVGPAGVTVAPILDEQKVALAGIMLGAWTVGWLALVLKALFSRRA